MRVLTAVLCASLSVGCAPATEPAKLAVNRDHLDFGAVEAGFTSRLAIALSNPGDNTLHVTELTLEPATPGLSLEGLPVDALAPGERKVVVVVYTPTADGALTAALRVKADDGLETRVIPLTGNVFHLAASARLDQGASCAGQVGSLDFGTVLNGVPTSRQVTLESTGSGDIGILGVTISPAGAGFSIANFGSGFVLSPGQTRALTVNYDPKLGGPQRGLISLETNSLAQPVIEIPICSLGMVSAICATPSMLQFGVVGPGASAVAQLTATSCGNLPVVLNTVSLTGAAGFTLVQPLNLPRTLAAGQAADIGVQFGATTTLSARARVQLSTSSVVTPLVVVQAGANLPPPCDVSIRPDPVQFFRYFDPEPVRITNNGTNDCIIDRIDIVPAGSPFGFVRRFDFPTALPAKSSLEVPLHYVPPMGDASSAFATLEVEFDTVHSVALSGIPIPPSGCHLVPSSLAIDFGLIEGSATTYRTFALANVGRDRCEMTSSLFDRIEFGVVAPVTSLESGATTPVTVRFTSATPVSSTLTIVSNDRTRPQLKILAHAGQVRCDPSCECSGGQTHTYWRFSPKYLGSAVGAAGSDRAIHESCGPRSCGDLQVSVEVGRGTMQCAAAPPVCSAGMALDFQGDHFVCVPCALIVQFGGLYDGMRACAPNPSLSCMSGMSPTFDARARTWSCVTSCNNGAYDQHTLPGQSGFVCIPC